MANPHSAQTSTPICAASATCRSRTATSSPSLPESSSLTALSPAASAGTKQLLNDSWHSTLSEALTAETVNQLRVIETPAARARIEAFTRKSERKAGP